MCRLPARAVGTCILLPLGCGFCCSLRLPTKSILHRVWIQLKEITWCRSHSYWRDIFLVTCQVLRICFLFLSPWSQRRCTDRRVLLSNQHYRALWIQLDSGEETGASTELGGASASTAIGSPSAPGSRSHSPPGPIWFWVSPCTPGCLCPGNSSRWELGKGVFKFYICYLKTAPLKSSSRNNHNVVRLLYTCSAVVYFHCSENNREDLRTVQ